MFFRSRCDVELLRLGHASEWYGLRCYTPDASVQLALRTDEQTACFSVRTKTLLKHKTKQKHTNKHQMSIKSKKNSHIREVSPERTISVRCHTLVSTTAFISVVRSYSDVPLCIMPTCSSQINSYPRVRVGMMNGMGPCQG